MDQTLTGSAGIDDSAMGDGARAHVIQQLIAGEAGIATGQQFPRKSGVYIEPNSIPYAVWVAI